MGKHRFKKRSKFQKFQLNNFTFIRPNERKVNSVRPDMTYSKELEQKNIMLDKFIKENI